MNEHLKVA